MMDDTKTGMGWGGILLIFVVIWILFGAFNGGGWGNNRGNGYDNVRYIIGDGYNGGCGCNRVSNCEMERREIIDSANTQYLIEQQAAATRAAITAGTAEITAQNERIYVQGLNEKIFDLKSENQTLKSEAYTKELFSQLAAQSSASFCALNQRLDGIECRMLTKPTLNGVAVTNCGQLVPASACGCGCGNI